MKRAILQRSIDIFTYIVAISSYACRFDLMSKVQLIFIRKAKKRKKNCDRPGIKSN